MKKRLTFATLILLLAGFLIAGLPGPNAKFWINPPVWDDIRVPFTSVKLAGVKDPSFDVFLGATRAWAFSNTQENEAYFDLQATHKYRLNSELQGHIHWSPSTTGSGDVQWCFECTTAAPNGTFGSTVTSCELCAADGVAYKHQICNIWDYTTGFASVSGMIKCRVYRDVTGGDDYAAKAFAHEIDFHIQIDSDGSRQTFVK